MVLHRSHGLWLLALCVAGALAGLGVGDELEEEHSLDTDFVTPHTRWARPYAQGKTRVLFFCSGRGTVPREVVELRQRFDLDVEVVYWARIVDTTISRWHGGEPGVERMLRILRKPFDCYVFIGLPITHLPVEAQFRVLKPVTDGAGLVLVGKSDKRVLKKRSRLDPPPFLAQAQPQGAFKVRQGRGVLLPGLPKIPYRLGWQTDYEYWAERFGRCIVWAAGKEPKVQVKRLAVTPSPVPWSDVTKATVALDLTRSAKPLDTQLYVRRHDGLRVRCGERLPALRAGAYHLDLHVTSADGVETWATTPFDVVCDRRVDAVQLDRDWAEVGETISGSVDLTDAPTLGAESLRVALRDRRGRILAQVEVDPAADTAFQFAVRPWFPMLLRVEAVLVSRAREVAMAYSYCHVTKRHRGQFNFLIWDTPRGSLAPYGEESLARLGTTLQLGHGSPSRVLAAYDIAWVQYTTRILARLDAKRIMKPQCWNDEPKVDAFIQKLAVKAEQPRRHGAYVYSLGDENHVSGACAHPACLDAYRAYLEQQYGTIDKLNASWAATYTSFSKVNLLDPEDTEGKFALQQKNYPRWYDRQAFKSWNYVMYCKRFASAYREVDPKSLTGFEGAGRFRTGDDIDLFVRELEFWSPYPSPADEVLRSIAPRDFPRSNWMGYKKEADPLIWKYWRMVTRGCSSVWWWRWDGIGRFHGLLAPHLGPWPATRELVEDTQVVRDGLGDLLMRADMLDDGIAMLYSMPSCFATKVEDGASYGANEACHVAWHECIRDLGLQFRYVTDRMLRLGEFDASLYKVLLLSRAEALGPEEAKAIEAFARAGGTVIADVRPGMYDGHCKPLATGALDALFGIRRTGAAAAAAGPASITLGKAKFEAPDQACDPCVRVATGTALGRLGDAPLMVRNRVGRGQAVLLNLSPRFFPLLSSQDTPEALADFFQELFAQAGVRPAVRTRTKGGGRVRGVETVRWRTGSTELVALFRKDGEEEDVTVSLPAPRHAYDLRHEAYRGQTAGVLTRIYPNRPTFLALTEAKVIAPRLSLDASAAHPGAEAMLTVRVPGAAGLHAVRLRARMPSGEQAEWLNQVVLVGDKPQRVPVPIAYNDPRGAWTLRGVELFTEQAGEATLIVE